MFSEKCLHFLILHYLFNINIIYIFPVSVSFTSTKFFAFYFPTIAICYVLFYKFIKVERCDYAMYAMDHGCPSKSLSLLYIKEENTDLQINLVLT